MISRPDRNREHVRQYLATILFKAAHLWRGIQKFPLATAAPYHATPKVTRANSASLVSSFFTIDCMVLVLFGLRKSCCHDLRTPVLGLVVPLRDQRCIPRLKPSNIPYFAAPRWEQADITVRLSHGARARPVPSHHLPRSPWRMHICHKVSADFRGQLLSGMLR